MTIQVSAKAAPRDPTRNVDPTRALDLARQVMTTEARAIAALAARLSTPFVDAVELILHCRGRVVVSGIGKSGHVARKLAATLDGRIATRTGESKWITGTAARADVHGWRRLFPAIGVGAGTVCRENTTCCFS